jgi:hypothetical protein
MKKIIHTLVKDITDNDIEKNVIMEIRSKRDDKIIGKCTVSEILKTIEEQPGEINRDYYFIKPSVYKKKVQDEIQAKIDHEKWIKENSCAYCGSAPGWEHDWDCPTRGYNRF